MGVALDWLSRDGLATTPPGCAEFEERLERGEIVGLRPGILELPSDADLEFLRAELPGRIDVTRKNISYHPEGSYLTGMKTSQPGDRNRVKEILREHNQRVVAVVERILPHYAERWRLGKVNFRPFEEKGRDLSVHASNELIHVDSGASGPTRGDRILRFFTNIHPTTVRVWKMGGRFPELYREFKEASGLSGIGARSLRPTPWNRAFSGFLRLLTRAGVPQAELHLDGSPYDRAMRRFHNFLKENDAFQNDGARIERCEFPPWSSWLVLSDMVSHGVISGRHALVSTFRVRLEDCRVPELAPYHVMASEGAERVPV